MYSKIHTDTIILNFPEIYRHFVKFLDAILRERYAQYCSQCKYWLTKQELNRAGCTKIVHCSMVFRERTFVHYIKISTNLSKYLISRFAISRIWFGDGIGCKVERVDEKTCVHMYMYTYI